MTYNKKYAFLHCEAGTLEKDFLFFCLTTKRSIDFYEKGSGYLRNLG